MRRADLLKAALTAAVVCLGAHQAWAAGPKSTNVTVDTLETGLISLNEKTEPKEKNLQLYQEGDTSIGFNDEGEPNWGTHF